MLQDVVWEVKNKIRGKGKFKKIDVNVKIGVLALISCTDWFCLYC